MPRMESCAVFGVIGRYGSDVKKLIGRLKDRHVCIVAWHSRITMTTRTTTRLNSMALKKDRILKYILMKMKKRAQQQKERYLMVKTGFDFWTKITGYIFTMKRMDGKMKIRAMKKNRMKRTTRLRMTHSLIPEMKVRFLPKVKARTTPTAAFPIIPGRIITTISIIRRQTYEATLVPKRRGVKARKKHHLQVRLSDRSVFDAVSRHPWSTKM